jgi:tetratricopeptide (TPR) repeat protein
MKKTFFIAVLAVSLSFWFAATVCAQSKSSEDFGRAVAEMKAGRFDTARPLLEAIIKKNPGHLEARNNLAVCLIKAKLFTEAEAQLNYVLAADPEKAGSHQNLGVAHQGLKKPDDAAKETDKAAQLFDSQMNAEAFRASAFFNKAWLLDEQGKLKEAIEAYTVAVALRPDYSRAQLGMAIALAKDNRLMEAKAAFEKAQRTKGSDREMAQLIETNRPILVGALQKAGIETEPPTFFAVGLAGRLGFYEKHRVWSILLYIIGHLSIFGFVQAGVVSHYCKPLSGDEVFKDFLICFLLGGLLFLIGWGYLHWVILLIVALATGTVGAATTR